MVQGLGHSHLSKAHDDFIFIAYMHLAPIDDVSPAHTLQPKPPDHA